jgi:hypothetical protein
MARVFLWRPNEERVGHLSMELNRDKTYISFWPKTDKKFKNLFGNESTICTLEQDIYNEGGHFDDYIAIPEEMINHDRIVRWWNEERPKEYSLLSYNCARCVYDALQAGGFKVYHQDWKAILSKPFPIYQVGPKHSIYSIDIMGKIHFCVDDGLYVGDLLSSRWEEDKPVKPETAFE